MKCTSGGAGSGRVSAKFEDSQAVSYPSTAYFLGILYAMTAGKCTLGELKESMTWIKSQMTRERDCTTRLHPDSDRMRGGGYRSVQVYRQFCALRSAYQGMSATRKSASSAYRWLPRHSGFVVIIGAAPSDEKAVEIIKSYQTKSVFGSWSATSASRLSAQA
jgi:hypothetical protein